MPEKITAEAFISEIAEKIADTIPKQKSVSFFEDDRSNTVSSQFTRLFGRQKPVYHLLGGGKSADVLLWRNKKISASILASATIIWLLFEWLDYHFLTLLCFALVLGMLVQFLWVNVSGLMKRPSKVPRLVVPNEVFVNIGKSIGAEVNQALRFLQDVALSGNLKQFLLVVLCLWAAAVVGSWCNFLTVLYIGFVAAHILPVFYERYEDQVDGYAFKVFGQLKDHYRKVDAAFLSKIPKGKHKLIVKKYE